MKILLILSLLLPNLIFGTKIPDTEIPKDSSRYFSFGNRLAYNYFDETTVHFFCLNGLVADEVNNNIFRYSYLNGQFDTLKERKWVKADAVSIDSIGEFPFSYGYGNWLSQGDSFYLNFYRVTFKVEDKILVVFLFSEKDKTGFMESLKSKPISFLKFPSVRRSFYLIENRFTLEYDFENGNGMIDRIERSYVVVDE